MELFAVPSPDDDKYKEVTDRAIERMIRDNEPELMELSQQKGYDLNSANTMRRIIRDCWTQSDFQFRLKSRHNELMDESMRFEDCLKLMEMVSNRNPREIFNITIFENDLGLRYRRIWLSES